MQPSFGRASVPPINRRDLEQGSRNQKGDPIKPLRRDERREERQLLLKESCSNGAILTVCTAMSAEARQSRPPKEFSLSGDRSVLLSLSCCLLRAHRVSAVQGALAYWLRLRCSKSLGSLRARPDLPDSAPELSIRQAGQHAFASSLPPRPSQCKRPESRISSKVFSPLAFSALIASLRFKGRSHTGCGSAAPSLCGSSSHIPNDRRSLTEPASRERSPSRAINFDACYLAGFADHARLATRKQQKKGK